tara:strand:+ start:1029 stop:1436 length:408 start_codon:yes stop_codon:yes gene_type:complete
MGMVKILISIGILIILVVGFYYTTKTISQVTGSSILGWIIGVNREDGELDDFAKFLTEEGVVLYSREGCIHCKAQKSDFGTSVQYLTIVECSENAEICEEKNLIGVPAWEIPGQDDLIYRRQSIEELAELTGYEF